MFNNNHITSNLNTAQKAQRLAEYTAELLAEGHDWDTAARLLSLPSDEWVLGCDDEERRYMIRGGWTVQFIARDRTMGVQRPGWSVRETTEEDLLAMEEAQDQDRWRDIYTSGR